MSTSNKLSKITKVDIRDYWQNEASDFTPWLASEENISLLAEALEMNELEVIAQEEHVGPFRADILCKDSDTDKFVLIENQLEKTDHSHLGQILTYAAGLDAVTIIWIAKNFTEEHRAAIDWLNRITSTEFNFFGVEINLIKIENSPVAPIFTVIAKPNDWSKNVRSSSNQISYEDLGETRKAQYDFWCNFCEFMKNNPSKDIRTKSPRPRHYMDIAIGRTGFWISLILSKEEISTKLLMNDENFFNTLYSNKSQAENKIGETLTWKQDDGKKKSSIGLSKSCDFTDTSTYPELFKWLRDYTLKFISYFKPIILKL